jgi:hypothetical protein
MKNVVLYERIPTKFILYFSQLYLIWNKFLKFRNVYMYRCIDKEVSFVVFLPEHGWAGLMRKRNREHRAWLSC